MRWKLNWRGCERFWGWNENAEKRLGVWLHAFSYIRIQSLFCYRVSRMKVVPLLLAVSLILGGCGYLTDTVANNYDTLADARADRLFERGWLPDILPETTTDIRTSNDLDISVSVGEFRFPRADAAAFYAKLQPEAPESSPLRDWNEIVVDYSRSGHTKWQYRDSDTTWAFFCTPKADRCEYRAWLR